MRKLSKKIFLAVLFFMLALLPVTTAWAVSLSFVPTSSDISTGESTFVDVWIDGLGENMDPSLAAFEFHVHYDPTILSFESYTLGTELTDPLFGQDDYSMGLIKAGDVHIGELSWLFDFSSQPDSFLLTTLSFSGIAAGTSYLNLGNVFLSDPHGSPLTGITINAGMVNVSNAVPEPTSIALFGLGLASLVIFRSSTQK